MQEHGIKAERILVQGRDAGTRGDLAEATPTERFGILVESIGQYPDMTAAPTAEGLLLLLSITMMPRPDTILLVGTSSPPDHPLLTSRRGSPRVTSKGIVAHYLTLDFLHPPQ